MPGLKKFSKRGDPTCVGGSPTQKYYFVYFSTEVIIGPVRVPLIDGGLKRGIRRRAQRRTLRKPRPPGRKGFPQGSEVRPPLGTDIAR